MKIFRKYLNQKLNSPEFKEAYEADCCICKITALLMNKLTSEGVDLEELAGKAGCDPSKLRNLETGDRCCEQTVKRLHDFLGMQMPGECKKLLP